jgi:membrane-associated phospholipid phosphatase
MKWDRKFYFKISLVVYFIWSIAFEAVGWYASTLPTRDFTTYIDMQIPFIPAFVWPYVLCYVFPFLSLFVVKDWHRFNRALLSIILANLSAFVLYLIIPIAFTRPGLGESLSERLLSFIYPLDFHPGANKLPSLHVTFAWITYLACRGQQLNRFGDSVVFLLAVAITFAALFVKQHLVLDVVAGLVWAVSAWILAGYLYRSLTNSYTDARAGLRLMTEKLFPVVFVFSAVLSAIIWIR